MKLDNEEVSNVMSVIACAIAAIATLPPAKSKSYRHCCILPQHVPCSRSTVPCRAVYDETFAEKVNQIGRSGLFKTLSKMTFKVSM